LCGENPTTIRGAITRGDLAAYRTDGRYRIGLWALRLWLESRGYSVEASAAIMAKVEALQHG
jgi:hypothetical protein